MMRKLLTFAAWLCLGGILFATVSPIGLRPRDVMPVNVDRALAFCIMAGLFTLAYPRRWLAILLLTVGGAALIETLQYLSPTRHAQLSDAMIKAAGAATGVAAARVLLLFAPREKEADGIEHPAGEDDPDPEEFSPEVRVLWTSESDGDAPRT